MSSLERSEGTPMKIISAAILIASVPLATANAQLGKDASYFCTAEFAGGIFYDAETRKWKGSALSANNRLSFALNSYELVCRRSWEATKQFTITRSLLPKH